MATSTGEYVKVEKKSKLQNFCEFLYDKQAGTVLGRTGSSWLQIFTFYVFFYSFLTGFFAVCLYVFVITLDDNVPRFYGKGSLIGSNPGMGYQPWLKDDAESTLIFFNYSNAKTYEKYVDSMKEFLEKYKNTTGTRACAGEQSNQDESDDSCRVTLDMFKAQGCSAETNFGFGEGKPCVIVSLNRLIDWRPVAYPKNSVPDVIKDRYDPRGSVAINCVGEFYADQENIGAINYIPRQGLDWRYFPYRKMTNYHQPIAMVKFMSLPKGVLVEVECHAYAYNILQDQTDRLGMVHFEVLVDG